MKKLYSITLLPGATTSSELLQAFALSVYFPRRSPELLHRPNFVSLLRHFEVASLISSPLSGKLELAHVVACDLFQNLSLHSPILVHSSHTYIYHIPRCHWLQDWALASSMQAGRQRPVKCILLLLLCCSWNPNLPVAVLVEPSGAFTGCGQGANLSKVEGGRGGQP